MFLLLAHDFDSKEEECLRAHAAVVASFDHDDQKEMHGRVDGHTHLVVALQHDYVQHDEGPRQHLSYDEREQEVRAHKVAATHVKKAKHVHLEVWSTRLELHLWHQVEGVRDYGEWQLYAKAIKIDKARCSSRDDYSDKEKHC